MKCFAITLKDQRNAMIQLKRCIESGKHHGWSIEPEWAVVGSTLSNKSFKRIGIKIDEDTTIAKRYGAQGCFMSHYTLWKRCIQLDEPIVILESDAVIIDRLPELDLTSLVRLHEERGNKHSKATGKWGLGAFGYALAPIHAVQLIEGAKRIGLKPVDKLIGDRIVDWRYIEKPVLQHERLGPSTTSKMYYV